MKLKKKSVSQELIVKSNKLIEARYRLSLIESRIIFKLASCIKLGDKEFQDYEFKVSDLLKEFGMDEKNYNIIKDATYKLISKGMRIHDIEGKRELQISFLSSALYLEKEGTLRLRFDPDLSPFLLELKKCFTSYPFECVKKLRSVYSMRLYELLRQYLPIGYRTEKLDWLRNWLCLEIGEYKQYGDFKKYILLVAQKELSIKTKLAFNFKEIKRGRKVDAIEFFIYESVEKVEKPLIELLVNDFKLEQSAAKEFLEKYAEKRILNNLEYVKKRQQQGKIKSNIGGYTRRAIEKDYFTKKPISEKLQEEKEKKKKLEMKSKKKIDQLLEDFENDSNIKAAKIIKNLYIEKKNELLKEFSDKADDFIKNKYLQNGLKSLLVRMAFDLFILEKYGSQEDRDFIKWADMQGHRVELVEGKPNEYILIKR